MLALIFDEDQHSRTVLSQLLLGMGFDHVLTAKSLEEAIYFMRENLDQMKLILCTNVHDDGLDLPISRFIIQSPHLDMTPLVVMLNEPFPLRSARTFRSRLSRVDDYLQKPFGLAQLKESISRAHQRRAELRSTIAVLGEQMDTRLIESVYASQSQTHWKAVVSASTLDDLKAKITEQRFRVGTILLDPKSCNDRVLHWLSAYKKTPVGAGTPVVYLSHNNETIASFRLNCDLFFDAHAETKVHDWSQLLSLLSKRLLHDWEAKALCGEARSHLKKNAYKSASKLINRALKIDPDRNEFLDLAGTVALKTDQQEAATNYFKKSLVTNPCNPYPYLSLLKHLQGTARQELLLSAKRYCPSHPQILKETQDQVPT